LACLAFGGDRHHHYRFQPEFSAALMLSDHQLIGEEYRAKPDNIKI